MSSPIIRNQPTLTAISLLVVAMSGPLPALAQPSRPAATAEFKTERQPLSAETLRIIPVGASVPGSDKYEACRICGIVESISLTEYENVPGIAADPEEIGNDVSGKSEKSRGNPLLTSRGLNSAPHADRIQDRTSRQKMKYYVKVRMEDGTFRIVTQPSQPGFSVGDRVRVTSGAVITT